MMTMTMTTMMMMVEDGWQGLMESYHLLSGPGGDVEVKKDG
jgi:hypothetical protein